MAKNTDKTSALYNLHIKIIEGTDPNLSTELERFKNGEFDINEKIGGAAIHAATHAKVNRSKLITDILNLNADVNSINTGHGNNTPLHLSIFFNDVTSNEQYDATVTLLNNNADPNIENKKKVTPFSLLFVYTLDNIFQHKHYAAKLLMLQKGADINKISHDAKNNFKKQIEKKNLLAIKTYKPEHKGLSEEKIIEKQQKQIDKQNFLALLALRALENNYSLSEFGIPDDQLPILAEAGDLDIMYSNRALTRKSAPSEYSDLQDFSQSLFDARLSGMETFNNEDQSFCTNNTDSDNPL